MTPERRSEGLAAAARNHREELLDLAAGLAAGAELVAAPAAGSVMVELDSAVGSFCVVEAVVTTASVRVAGRPGWGCVMGWDEEGALAAALLDATRGKAAEELVEAALAGERAAARRDAEAVAATRVGDR